ncbi:AIPR family protein [Hymenobacter persicinus]|uniref:Abortive phage infection protein C-terminal domain-containing protein n=1 Tax=Hymenobacter persicinus TaxID=2025506 RepID=A0A4Q5LC15_9BACT|nr:AIPR family protein [Hymenobacter persicinus]RYU77682.1 hypothetical protein EWM57_17305 [Hymenobacter persicinus]
MSAATYLRSFKAATNLIAKLGEANAYMIWAIGLYLEEPDLEALASEALTDGNDDKKVDFIYLDRDNRKLIVAQGYYSTNARSLKDVAPANKASDLNTASAWLFSGDISTLPDNLKNAISEFRKSFDLGEIEQIDFVYVHNLSESVNVERELKTVAGHIKSAIGLNSPISVTYKELGWSTTQTLFASQKSHITVKDLISVPYSEFLKQDAPGWQAFILSVPGKWLHELFAKHGESLFSANYRGFLGITKRRTINNAIRDSAERFEQDFWVYNNGITILTNNIDIVRKTITISGISVINGAQTTGSLGSIDSLKHPMDDVKVLCRIIRCDDPAKISSIVKYNNTQNAITTWDQYSGDTEQIRIAEEFNQLGHTYIKKQGFRPGGNLDEIGIEDVAQSLISFKGRYGDANAGKNNIFISPPLYKLAFEGKKARHILFVYCMARAIDDRRLSLKNKVGVQPLIDIEQKQLNLLRNLRFKYFLISLFPSMLEPILDWPVDNDMVAFNPVASKKENHSIISLVALCVPIVNKILSIVVSQIKPDRLNELIQDEAEVKLLKNTASALLMDMEATPSIEEFKKMVSAS